MKRWGYLFLTIALLAGCAPAAAQTVAVHLGQGRTAVAAPVADAPSLTAPTVPHLRAFRPAEGGEGESAPSDAAAPSVPQADTRRVAAHSNALAIDILHTLSTGTPRGNLLYSPVSIYSAFALLYAGAGGETAAQMAEVLHYDPGSEAFHAALGSLAAALGRGGADGVTVMIANALWGQRDIPFTASFLDLIEQYYGAGLQGVDFQGDPAGAASAVNDWISDATGGMIPSVVQGFDPATLLVLANAIYFDADWPTPFDSDATRPEPFSSLDGSTGEVDMMHVTHEFAYAEGAGYQVVALPYAGGSARMIVILPAEGDFERFEASLTTESLDRILSDLDGSERRVALSLPAFDYESTTDLRDVLGQMGLTLPFSDHAEFSGIAEGLPLAVDQAIHKARITVDETGTEAAAATVIGVVTLSAPMESDPVTMTVNRPFITLIQEMETDALLFVGRIVSLK